MLRGYRPASEALEVVVVRPPADRCADETPSGEVADDDVGLGQPRDDVGRLVGGDAPGHERRALVRYDDVAAGFGERAAEALGHLLRSRVSPLRNRGDRGAEARHRSLRSEVRVEARGPVLGAVRTVGLVALLGEVARARDAQRLGVGDDERSRPLRAAQPLLPGHRVVVETGRVDVDDADRLRAVDEDRETGPSAKLVHGQDRARRPEDVRDGDEPRAGRHCRDDPLRIRLDDDDPRSGRVERADEPEVLVRRRDDLVLGPELETCEHDVAAVGGRCRQRHRVGRDTDERRDLGAEGLALLDEARELRDRAAPLVQAVLLGRTHRLDRPASERPDAAGLQVGVALEHRELSARFLERSPAGFCRHRV